MTSITFLDKPSILVFKIKDDSVVAYNTLLDYSESDFVLNSKPSSFFMFS